MIKVYLDTGNKHIDVMFRGFDGSSMKGLDEVIFYVMVNGVDPQVTAVVVFHDLVNADLLLGQSVLASSDIVFMTSEGRET